MLPHEFLTICELEAYGITGTRESLVNYNHFDRYLASDSCAAKLTTNVSGDCDMDFAMKT